MRKAWDLIRPTVVLIIICAVISGLLALTYNLAGVADLANAAYSTEELELFASKALPEADVLKMVKVSSEEEDLKFVYKAENGAGIALVTEVKGYASENMVIMYGFDNDGVMQGLYVISHAETPGLGEKITTDEAYLGQYAGQTAGNLSVDTIAGSTKTSGGIRNGAARAFELFDQVSGEVLG